MTKKTHEAAVQAMKHAILKDFAKNPRNIAFRLDELKHDIAPYYREAIHLAWQEWRGQPPKRAHLKL